MVNVCVAEIHCDTQCLVKVQNMLASDPTGGTLDFDFK